MNPITVSGQATNINQQFSLLEKTWSPVVIAQTNEFKTILLLAEGDFIWHTHEDEDKLFMVIEGELFIDFKSGQVISIKQGEFFIVPKGEESKPWSKVLTKLLLIEPIIAKPAR
ncbi:cupin domain-containing protein [Serratia fonticola]|uniref:cupin domain-containing protein n=1 Tax=Serratia fonticola TaxID=47917 RepID=UPI00157633F8|nr:cupin domain-containing protein [Serratia fonticola]NTY85693.1 cupin domain-containing protein [Serratia fonticola]NTZ11464.1 cupin domain-containing protein [Serratia fonticola]